MLKKISPRKGTETKTKMRRKNYGRLKKISPRKGTETALYIVLFESPNLVKEDKSPKGDGNPM